MLDTKEIIKSASFFTVLLSIKAQDRRIVQAAFSLLEYYKWKGLLAQNYYNFKFPSNQSDYTLAKAYSMNPNYPSRPAFHLCRPTLYEPSKDESNYYALRNIGYISVPETGQYIFRMFCDEICQLNMTKYGSLTVLGDYNDVDKER